MAGKSAIFAMTKVIKIVEKTYIPKVKNRLAKILILLIVFKYTREVTEHRLRK
jgi:hypothetical protein